MQCPFYGGRVAIFWLVQRLQTLLARYDLRSNGPIIREDEDLAVGQILCKSIKDASNY